MNSEYTYGTFGGAAGVLFSYPVDTLTVRIQTGSHWRKKSFEPLWRGLYRGISSPLVLMSLEKMIVFGVYNNMKEQMSRWEKSCFPKGGEATFNSFISGFVSGAACTGLVTPLERLKINVQIDNKKTYRSQLSRMNLRTLYQGGIPSGLRETSGYAIYFTVYEMLKRQFNSDTAIKQFTFGAISGISSWVFIYPFDTIKTRMQSDSYSGGILKIVKKEGFSGLYKGIYSRLLFAGIRHGATFLGYEQSKRLLSKF